ncbi:MAG: hypothetical protein LBR25_02140 [Erysipelotrichaceae bacterium]|jgi:hypothetical protein|nr:hypothetical protein [Erysipelotrichaceae bacterium]
MNTDEICNQEAVSSDDANKEKKPPFGGPHGNPFVKEDGSAMSEEEIEEFKKNHPKPEKGDHPHGPHGNPFVKEDGSAMSEEEIEEFKKNHPKPEKGDFPHGPKPEDKE